MFEHLRNLRHKDSVKDLLTWNKIGAFYRYVIGYYHLILVSINLLQKFKFKLHARFAFSNFKNWGNKHNDFFLFT